ncbi:MAG: SPFH domain-containing protein [Anaerolineae bacterium]|nr:SPFH domain-containing protein [Anaerolineae bacterium]
MKNLPPRKAGEPDDRSGSNRQLDVPWRRKEKLDMRPPRSIFAILAIVVIGGILLFIASRFFYFLAPVEQNEVGVQFRNGQIAAVVGPGLYSDAGLYVELKTINQSSIPFTVQDDEIITSDKQRVGVIVNGDIFRPTIAQADLIRSNWASYSDIYISDTAAKGRVEALARQAMKVCVGQRTFENNVIGSARDELRTCIDDELSKLATNYALQINNVTVPNIILSPEVQGLLDEITKSRLETEKADQDRLRAEAQALAEQAKQRGEVAVAQARIQEEAKQQTVLAQLEKDKLLAQSAVIETQKANDLLGARKDLEINTARALAAAEKAKADLANNLALAEMYDSFPTFLQLQIATQNAAALKQTDKIIFTPEGTAPTIVLPGPGIVPTINTNPDKTNPGNTNGGVSP